MVASLAAVLSASVIGALLSLGSNASAPDPTLASAAARTLPAATGLAPSENLDVQPTGAAADVAGASCTDQEDTTACLTETILAVYAEAGATAATAQLAELIYANDWARNACHEPSHVLGRTSYEATGTLRGALNVGGSVCENGYYHGVYEAWGNASTEADLLRDGWASCALPGMKALDFPDQTCGHALGHGVWAIYGDQTRAAEFCATSNPAPDADLYCASGVMMMIIQELDPGTPEYPDTPAKIDALCGEFDKLAYICYEDAAWPLYVSHGADATASLAACAELAPSGVSPCARKIGKSLAVPLASAASATACSSGPPSTILGCFTGAAGAISARGPKGSTVEADALCALAPSDVIQSCRDSIRPGA